MSGMSVMSVMNGRAGRVAPVFAGLLALIFAAACEDSVPPGTGGGADAAPETDGEVDMEPTGDMGGEPAPCTSCDVDDDCPEASRCRIVDGLGYCLPTCGDGIECPDGYVCSDEAGGDCLPLPGVCIGCAEPGSGDDACDGYDNDCDGIVDEDFVAEQCGTGACAAESRCMDGVLAECENNLGLPAPDDSGCDGVDDDCDGTVDEDYEPVECGSGPCLGSSACVDGIETPCTPSDAARVDDASCDGIDDDCDGVFDEDYDGSECGTGACVSRSACVDGAEMCTPGVAADDDASCDGIDDDCDGAADEDFASDESCGLGECRAQVDCVGGEMSCEPRAPLFVDIDQNCDGLDEDCDGQVDEDCVDNSVGFDWVSDSEEQVDLDLRFDQSDDVDSPSARFFQPRIIELVVILPETLTPLATMRETVERGPATIAANKLLNAVVEDGNRLRITIMSVQNTDRIQPGVIAHLHLRRFPGAQPPFRLEFDENLSAFAPEESHDRLTLLGADVSP